MRMNNAVSYFIGKMDKFRVTRLKRRIRNIEEEIESLTGFRRVSHLIRYYELLDRLDSYKNELGRLDNLY